MKNIIKSCLVCNTLTTNKKYCCEECQYIAYSTPKLNKIEIVCLNCSNIFTDKETSKRKYCSKKCTDLHKKVIQRGKNNGMYGKTHSEHSKRIKSLKMKEIWTTDEHRLKFKTSINKFKQKNGHHPGWSEKSRENRKFTNIIRYGQEVVGLNIPAIYKKANDTCLDRYGQNLSEMGQKIKQNKNQTKIEKIIECFLKDVNVDYIFQFKFKNRFFDFGIPSLNILIEVDGDYWHGKDTLYENLNMQQLNTFRNDRYKDNLVINSDWKLIRIWETDVYKITINELKELLYGKGET